MTRFRVSIRAVLGGALLAAAAAPFPGSAQELVAWTGATVWDGTGAPAREGATILARGARIEAIGPAVEIPAGARVVALDGRWVIPGLVNAHGHVSGDWAPDPSASEEDRLRADLLLYARHGVTSVLSLGDGEAAIRLAEEAPSSPPHARLRASGAVITASDPAAARAEALARVQAGASWLKLRVDDNLGTSSKMPWPAVEAVLEVGRAHGVPIATHLFYLEDARRMLEMGTGLVAHSVRDRDVDDAFTAALVSSEVCYVPTLTREVSTYVYAERPDFFDDPFFRRHALEREVRRLEDPRVQAGFRASPTADAYRRALVQAQENLVALHEAGVRIAFGTDSGPAARFPGYFEHLELALMVEAGLTPAEALRSATAVAAGCAGFVNAGTLEPGRFADFLVLTGDPLADIEATRSLERVIVGGREVPLDGSGTAGPR